MLKISTKKVNENEACELYNGLIEPDRNTLMNAKGRGKNKRNNILSVLSNIESSIFDGVYLNYFDKQSESEESIAERTKLRRQRHSEIAEKKGFITFWSILKKSKKTLTWIYLESIFLTKSLIW